MKTNETVKKIFAGMAAVGFSLMVSSGTVSASEEEEITEEVSVDVSDESEESVRATVSCNKKINNTWGTVTCTTSGGAYTLKQIRFDCSAQGDKVYDNVKVNGSLTLSHECRFKLTRIQITI